MRNKILLICLVLSGCTGEIESVEVSPSNEDCGFEFYENSINYPSDVYPACDHIGGDFLKIRDNETLTDIYCTEPGRFMFRTVYLKKLDMFNHYIISCEVE